jgi:hypothetical protein
VDAEVVILVKKGLSLNYRKVTGHITRSILTNPDIVSDPLQFAVVKKGTTALSDWYFLLAFLLRIALLTILAG